MNEAYTFGDVLIEPKYSEILSRSDVNLSTTIGNVRLTLPIISSNMKTITGPKMAAVIASKGGLGILHRFCTVEDNIQMFKDAKKEYYKLIKPTAEQLVEKWAPILKGSEDNKLQTAFILEGQESSFETPPVNIGVSIGVKDEDKERFASLYSAGARIFCVDVAHGHHIHVKNMLTYINAQRLNDLTVIAGNIATAVAYHDMCEWGANAVKVGIGPSPVCRTRYNTGVGMPQLYALEQVYERASCLKKSISIIADGGIAHVGDIAKALKFADAVMIGSMIAGCSETPGSVYRNEDGEFYKTYGGSASGENKGENRFVEGVIKSVKFKGKVKYILREIEQGLQSAFSYTGSENLKQYKQNCEFTLISAGSQKESRI